MRQLEPHCTCDGGELCPACAEWWPLQTQLYLELRCKPWDGRAFKTPGKDAPILQVLGKPSI
jgi:hypothetical protein